MPLPCGLRPFDARDRPSSILDRPFVPIPDLDLEDNLVSILNRDADPPWLEPGRVALAHLRFSALLACARGVMAMLLVTPLTAVRGFIMRSSHHDASKAAADA